MNTDRIKILSSHDALAKSYFKNLKTSKKQLSFIKRIIESCSEETFQELVSQRIPITIVMQMVNLQLQEMITKRLSCDGIFVGEAQAAMLNFREFLLIKTDEDERFSVAFGHNVKSYLYIMDMMLNEPNMTKCQIKLIAQQPKPVYVPVNTFDGDKLYRIALVFDGANRMATKEIVEDYLK